MSEEVKVKKVRDSNMELLRIVAMLLVMILHADFASLSVPTFEQCNDSPLISFFRFFVEGLSVVAVNAFVLLSGWYGIKPSVKKSAGFIFQTLFLIFFVYFCFFVTGSAVGHSIGEWLKIAFFNQYWFVQCYILLIIFAPILNASVELLDRRTLLFVLLLMFIAQIVYGFLPYASIFGWYNSGYSPLTFFFLYLLARYVRLYGLSLQRLSSLLFFGGWALVALLMALLGFLTLYLGYGGYFLLYFYGYSSPLVIIGALLLLLAFSRISVKSSVINWIASSAFAAYIVHCHECVFDQIYKSHIAVWFAMDYTLIFVAKTAFLIIVLFCVSILIDKCRLLIWSLINKIYCSV